METVKSGFPWEVGWEPGRGGVAGETAFRYKTYCTWHTFFLTNGICSWIIGK